MEKTKEKCLFSNAKGTRPAKDGRKAIGDSVTCVFAAAFATQATVKKRESSFKEDDESKFIYKLLQ
ncbi:hypothetical protein A3781_07845 [Bacillus badius]|nr:hypothetical protein A3781_07845 [Bacillus badius]